MTEWIYEAFPPNGGAPGDAFTSSFNGVGYSMPVLLAREAIQNSVDARDDRATDEVFVRFRIVDLVGEKRNKLEEAIRLDQMRERGGIGGGDRGSCLEDTSGPLRLLFVEDFGTTGLSGDPTRNDANFRKLLMSFGLSDKPNVDETSGGSYGFGKSVYSATSRIQTIFAFSRTTDQEGNPLSLIMGCAYQRHHSVHGESYTGRAWFGQKIEDEHHGYRMDPFTGREAEELAEALGFDREPDQRGTSILVVDTDVAAEDLREGVEEYWWPRLVEGKLDVEIRAPDGTELPAMPRSRPHLQPFIDAWDVALGRTPPEAQSRDRQKFRRRKDHEIGSLGLVVLSEKEDGTVFEEPHELREDAVALVRSPLMVVAYHRKWNPSHPRVAGAFLAAEDIDGSLRLSEPPAHDDWSPDAQRLGRERGAADVVEAVRSRIRNAVKAFQKKARPPEPTGPKRLTELERRLARWFGDGMPKPPRPEPNPAPIRLHYADGGVKVRTVEDGLEAHGEVLVELPAEGEADRLDVEVDLQCLVVEEGAVVKDSALSLDVTIEHAGPNRRRDDGTFLVTMDKGDVARFAFRSAPTTLAGR